MQVSYGLSLHAHAFDSVVTRRQPPPLYVNAEPTQLRSNPLRLVHVRVDADHLNPHAWIVPSQTSRVCTYRRKFSPK